MKRKYRILLEKLDLAFENEKHHPVPDIIAAFRAYYKDSWFCFEGSPLYSAKTVKKVLDFIENECSYFSYTFLERFIQNSKCNKAKELMEDYIKYIENTYICVQTDTLKYKKDKNILEIIYEKDNLLVKELKNIIDTLERSLTLPKASALVKDVITQNCIICKISLKAKEDLLNNTFTAHKLKELSDLKVQSLVVEDRMKLKIPSDCDNEVIKVCEYQ